MYKVVIIDDEPIIVEGLKKIVPWVDYNCTVIGWAFDGNKGLELIRKEEPDIVFSDILMPGLDGLSMMAGLKSQYPKMEVSVLTGFRNFDYAQKAINLGVTRYLLKPSNMEDIKEAVVTMIGNIKAKNNLKLKDTSSQEPEPEAGEDQKAGSFLVNVAVEFMRENYNKKLTLSEVADHIYISQWHLSKLLNKHMGVNFSEILNSIRIKEAKILLQDPALRVGEIGEMVGFVDMAHFSRVFKKQVGTSANEYRNHINVIK